jgi:hypothetical protein
MLKVNYLGYATEKKHWIMSGNKCQNLHTKKKKKRIMSGSLATKKKKKKKKKK